MYDNRRYLIIPSSIVDDINFSQVHETSKDTLRYSVDGTKTFVKYDLVIQEEDVIQNYLNMETGEMITATVPAGVYGRPSIYSEDYTEYIHEEILIILGTEEWLTPIEYPTVDRIGE